MIVRQHEGGEGVATAVQQGADGEQEVRTGGQQLMAATTTTPKTTTTPAYANIPDRPAGQLDKTTTATATTTTTQTPCQGPRPARSIAAESVVLNVAPLAALYPADHAPTPTTRQHHHHHLPPYGRAPLATRPPLLTEASAGMADAATACPASCHASCRHHSGGQQQQQQHNHPLHQQAGHHHGHPKGSSSSGAGQTMAALQDGDDEAAKKFLADEYQRCCPPPMFIILISLLEIGVFVYDYITVTPLGELQANTKIPTESVLIYRPDRRLQIWRFISYMVLHANWFHLSFNIVIQLLFGLPLEFVHGSLRIAAVYLAGVFAGSLGTSVVDSEVYLVGASGGVYALLAAQLANILLNYGQMRYGFSQLASVVIFVLCDLGYAFYTKCLTEDPTAKSLPAVSYIAHLTGSMAGFTMGLLVLRNFEGRAQSNLLWWLALGVYAAFTIFAIVFNLINTMTAQLLEERGELYGQHLLHDLGVS